MKQIFNSIQLTEFLKEPNIIDTQTLRIQFKERQLAQNFLNEVPRKLPNVREFILHLCQINLANKFLINLQDILKEMHNLEIVQFYLHQTLFKAKQVKRFILAIRDRFYKDNTIEYSFVDDHILISCGNCQISFKYDENQSILIKGIKEEIIIRIGQEQSQFYKIIKQIILNEVENMHVSLMHENIKLECYNGSKSYDVKLSLIFKDMQDLFNFSITQHSVVKLSITESLLDLQSIQNTILISEINNRFNFSWNSNQIQEVISFNSYVIPKRQIIFLEDFFRRQTYFFQGRISNIYLLSRFKQNIYNTYALPSLIEYNYPIQFNIYINNYKTNYSHLFTIDKGTTNINEEKQKLNLYVSSFQQGLDLLKNFFDRFTKDDDYKLLKLTFYQKIVRRLADIDGYNQQIEDLNANILVKKLKLNIHFGQMKFAFIETMKTLQNLSLKFMNMNELTKFLDYNKNYLKFDKSKSLYGIKISFDYPIYGTHTYSSIKFNSLSLNRVANIYIFKCQYFPKNLSNLFKKFQRIVCFTVDKMKDVDENDEQVNYNYDYGYDYEEDYEDNIYFDNYLNDDEKLQIAYNNVNEHDDITCSIYRMQQCTCSNHQLDQILSEFQKKGRYQKSK